MARRLAVEMVKYLFVCLPKEKKKDNSNNKNNDNNKDSTNAKNNSNNKITKPSSKQGNWLRWTTCAS